MAAEGWDTDVAPVPRSARPRLHVAALQLSARCTGAVTASTGRGPRPFLSRRTDRPAFAAPTDWVTSGTVLLRHTISPTT